MDSVAVEGFVKIGLAGQPNTGKSTLFNRLTGAKQHVGNWPGKTVEQKSGIFHFNHKKYSLVDLPGTYSLTANSAEELIARDFIISDEVDMIITMVDTSQLERSMYLLSEMVGMNVPIIGVLNMIDVAKEQGKVINIEKLQEKLGIPIVPMVAAKGEGVESLLEKVQIIEANEKILHTDTMVKIYKDVFKEAFNDIMKILPDGGIGNCSRGWLGIRLLENDRQIVDLVKEKVTKDEWEMIHSIIKRNTDGPLKAANCRYAWIESVLDGVFTKKREYSLKRIGFDKLSTHRIFGKPIAVFMMILGFIASMMIAMPFMMGIGSILPKISLTLRNILLDKGISNWIVSLLTEAVVPSVSMAILMGVFIAGVVFIFGFMEDVGYMARVAYVFDTTMNNIGLHGKSIMPFVTSFGCNMAGITGSRVIDSWKQRLLTITTSMVVPCAAMWGVIGLVGSLFFGVNAIWVIVALFICSIFHIIFTSWIFRTKFIKEEDGTGLIMELPPYHKPNWKGIFVHVWSKMKDVMKKAFVVIVGVSVIMWALSYTSDGNIENSPIYAIGKTVEPIASFLGLDWRLFIALIVSIMSKEGALGVLSMLFGVGTGISSFSGIMISGAVQFDQTALSTVMLASVSKASALAFMFAYYFNIPCMAAIASVNAETHSLKWTIKIVSYYMVSALVIGGIVYRIGTMIF
ncbi:MAG: ferrous iron transport protein B [Anaeromicrobium sp.]|jgi:ferrous iron transport protein B|uniref:ferrous iron transport protein B n=1 Tax=Anaeromicrobium sp. TaxID=1929132 RepID=UPI0025EBE19A|nr:ferrous iron transport protein B [Anaeromicrobium sp.]MCT4596141.1 ferrous iron transport protein B [Anaeromicrobium sp.]